MSKYDFRPLLGEKKIKLKWKMTPADIPLVNGKFHYFNPSLNKFKQAVYAERETDQSDKLEELSADPVCIKYP